MRDLLLITILPFLIYFAVRRPFIGAALWLWTSLVPMQTWVYGVATSIRWNFIFAGCTILGYILMKNKPRVDFGSIFWMMTALLFLATLSSFLHQGIDVIVWARWERFFKAYIFFVFVYLIVDKDLHIEALMWACLMSITAVAALQGLKVAASGGGHVVYGISSTFNDNNLSAFATLVCIPFSLYLLSQYKNNLVFKLGLLGGIFTSVFFILGSDSRGGFMGLVVLFLYYFINSKRKLPITVVAIVIAGAGLSVMDASWFERMDSIQNANEDSSFMGRVIAWKLSLLLAIENPFLGGGFDAVAFAPTWNALLDNWETVSFIPSSYPTKGHVAHSIYFQILGDLGFIGFIIFYYVVYSTYKFFKRAGKNNTHDSLGEIAKYCNVSLICFLIAGAALSVAYNEIVIMLLAVSARIQSMQTNK